MGRAARRWLVRIGCGWLFALSLGANVALGQANYQGLWWNPVEAGWGINFAHQGDVIFATWFTYDSAGEPWWLVADLRKTPAGTYAGDVVSVTGPPFNAVPFDPTKVTDSTVGTMSVTFSSATQANLSYTVNGVVRTKAIAKQVFAADPTCVWGAQANLAAATNYQDLWWNPAESGWGVNFTHQGDVIFATWFTYNAAGKPWWLIAELRKTAAASYAGTVWTVKGPAFDAVTFDAAKVVDTVVGQASVTFADGNHASFGYTVNGVTQAKAVTRQVFVAPGTVCSATPTPPPLSVAEKRKDAARFLRQATFGAPREAIDALVAQGYEAWLAEQFAKPIVSHVAATLAHPEVMNGPMRPVQNSAWKQRFEGEDQLRQRVSDALLQIYVVSMYLNKLRTQATCALASYLDVLNRNAFGNFRDLLRDVTLSPAMGEYLSMKGSGKADAVLQTQPDENYAREVMQLFTVGLVMLNEDGSVQLGTDGKPLPTFNEDTVKGFAKALSGWHWAGAAEQAQPWRWNADPFLDSPDAAAKLQYACDAWSRPMQPWLTSYRSADNTRTIAGPAHDQGAKQLLAYPGAPYSTLPAGQTPQQDLENVLDNLFHHPNVGPFIGKQLIQRLVTSNPSPAYVARVARAFNDNGGGVRGDMKAVVRAILLDDEARNLAVARQPTFGKLTEPVVRFVQYFRSFASVASSYDLPWELDTPNGLNQQPLKAPSVFNFYSPDYSPAGPMAQANLVGPEFEITYASSVAGFGNFSQCWIPGWGSSVCTAGSGIQITPNFSYYLGLASSPGSLVDELDLLLCAGCLDPGLRAQIVGAVGRVTTGNSFMGYDVARERVHTALWLIVNSPDYLVQR
jgi:uncharacterized protein (DUF1800 family)